MRMLCALWGMRPGAADVRVHTRPTGAARRAWVHNCVALGPAARSADPLADDGLTGVLRQPPGERTRRSGGRTANYRCPTPCRHAWRGIAPDCPPNRARRRCAPCWPPSTRREDRRRRPCGTVRPPARPPTSTSRGSGVSSGSCWKPCPAPTRTCTACTPAVLRRHATRRHSGRRHRRGRSRCGETVHRADTRVRPAGEHDVVSGSVRCRRTRPR